MRELYDERIEFDQIHVKNRTLRSFGSTLISLRQLNEKVPPRNYNNDKPIEWNGIIDTIFALIKIFVHLIQKYFQMFSQLG